MDMYENADKKQQDIINEIDDYMKEEISNNNSGEDTSGNENNTGGSGTDIRTELIKCAQCKRFRVENLD